MFWPPGATTTWLRNRIGSDRCGEERQPARNERDRAPASVAVSTALLKLERSSAQSISSWCSGDGSKSIGAIARDGRGTASRRFHAVSAHRRYARRKITTATVHLLSSDVHHPK